MSRETRKMSYSSTKSTGNPKPQVSKRTNKSEDTAESYYDKYPRWMFQRCDFDHSKWGMLCNSGKLTDFFRYLSNLECQKWGEILTDKSGRRSNTRNHHIPLTDIIREAQKRATEINVDEFDDLCSIAVSGRMRVWGYIIDGLFYIIWFDPEHEIYPSEKRHT